MLSKGERYRLRLDCIIIKRDKGRSEVKRLLTIAEDLRLIAYIIREVILSLSLPRIVAESVFSLSPNRQASTRIFRLVKLLNISCETNQHGFL